jgi:hypothetical protein
MTLDLDELDLDELEYKAKAAPCGPIDAPDGAASLHERNPMSEAEKMAARLEVRGQVHTDAEHHEKWGALYAEAAALIRKLAAENERLEMENVTLKMHAEARCIVKNRLQAENETLKFLLKNSYVFIEHAFDYDGYPSVYGKKNNEVLDHQLVVEKFIKL